MRFSFTIRWVISAFAALAVLPGRVQAQSSPYSRFGLGEIQSPLLAAGKGMGSSAAATRSYTDLNLQNPATLGGLKLSTLETGIFAVSKEIRDSLSGYYSNNASIAYLALGFPVSDRWGTAFGLQPYSRTSYKISDRSSDPLVGTMDHIFTGSGTLYKVFLANGFDLAERSDTLFSQDISGPDTARHYRKMNLSAGFEAGLVFGTIYRRGIIAYSGNLLATRSSSAYTISALDWKAGIHYSVKINQDDADEDVVLGAGIYGRPATGFSYSRYRSWERGDYENDRFYTEDTLVSDTAEKQSLSMPLTAGIAVSLSKSDRWVITAGYEFNEWTTFSLESEAVGLRDSWIASAGFEWIPDHDEVDKFWKRTRFRAGAWFTNGSLRINITDIPTFGITAGVGIPVKRVFSRINLSMEKIRTGTTENRLFREDYYRLTLGLTMNDKWFVKRKYD